MNTSLKWYGSIFLVLVIIFFLGFYSRTFLSRDSLLTGHAVNLAGEQTITNNLVAVDAQGNGVGAQLHTQVRPGHGLVLVNINNVLADLNTQQSARAAVQAASRLAHVDSNTIDVTFTIDTNAELVSGRSAGSTMAIAVATALMNVTARTDLVMTGDISEDGTIGMVQGIPQKAYAAKQFGASAFIVPVGGAHSVTHFAREKSCGDLGGYDYCTVTYVPAQGTLSDTVGIPVLEVETLADAARYYFGYEGVNDVDPQTI